jgi:hypothetical protein
MTAEFQLQETETGTVQLFTATGNFSVTLQLTDQNRDGTVTLVFNTHDPYAPAAFDTRAEADSVRVTQALYGPQKAPLRVGEYQITAAVDESVTASETFELTPQTVRGVSVATAPSGHHAVTQTKQRLYAAQSRGVVTSTEQIAAGDTVTLQMNAVGVFGALAETKERSDEQAFISLINEPGVTFELKQTNPPNGEAPKRLNVTKLTASQINVVPDAENETVYVSFRSRTTLLEQIRIVETLEGYTLAQPAAFAPGERYTVRFGLTAPADFDRQQTASFVIQPRTGQLTTNARVNGTAGIAVRRSSVAQIEGSTTVAPGTEVRIRVSGTADSRFVKSKTATVQPDRTFRAIFDFREIPERTTFNIEVTDAGFTTDVSAAGIVATNPTGTVQFENQTIQGELVSVRSARLSEGGFIALYRAAPTANGEFGELLGRTPYLEPGGHTDVGLRLNQSVEASVQVIAVAHLDTDEDQVFEYVQTDQTADLPYIGPSGQVAAVRATITSSPQSTPTVGGTTTPTSDGAATTTDTTVTGPGQPGFSPLILISAVVLLLIALSRD